MEIQNDTLDKKSVSFCIMRETKDERNPFRDYGNSLY